MGPLNHLHLVKLGYHSRFKAHPVGTHWYHTHLGTQRTEGAYGPLIVLDRSKDDENKRRVQQFSYCNFREFTSMKIFFLQHQD